MIEMKDLNEIYKMFEDHDVGEVEIQNGETRVRFSIGKKASKKIAPVATPAVSAPIAEAKPTTEPQKSSNVYDMNSKWVGFFTRVNPKTGDNYIKLRDVVKKGSVIGHVRVLGVLQDLKSEVDGKVKEILVEEGHPIEYGQPIMRFEV